MKILTSGAGGFVGSHLCEAELDNGHEVYGMDIADPVKVRDIIGNQKFHYIQESVLNQQALESLVKKCDLFYHFAAIADPKMYCEKPVEVLRLDLEATQTAVKLCHKYGKKLVFASTSEVFGKNPLVPWNEESDRVLGPCSTSRWVYSSSKAVGEHYCHAYGKNGLKFVILRFFNFYGPRLDFLGTGRVMTCFLQKFLNGEPVEVVEPGDQTRCFTYISDGVDGIIKASKKNNVSYNLGTSDEISMKDLAILMKEVGGFESEINMIPAQEKYGEGYEDIFRRIPDCSKAEKELKWSPKVSLTDGIRKTIDAYRDIAT